MAKVKDQIAQLGMGTLVAGLKAVESGVSKKQYKRLIATAVAQLLTMHPDFGPGQARRRARKVTGAKPAKKMLIKRKVTEKVKDAVEAKRESEDTVRQA